MFATTVVADAVWNVGFCVEVVIDFFEDGYAAKNGAGIQQLAALKATQINCGFSEIGTRCADGSDVNQTKIYRTKSPRSF